MPPIGESERKRKKQLVRGLKRCLPPQIEGFGSRLQEAHLWNGMGAVVLEEILED